MSKERRLMVRLTEAQHKAVRVRAAELGRPISEIVRELLDKWLDGRIDLEGTELEDKKENR